MIIRIKKLYRLVLMEFAGPFVLTFFISLFVLLMQFLWKYIDDLVGKGLEWTIIAELIYYTSITLIPLALPLAILVSSIMTFGNLAEHFEIVAGKAAGISLQKIMRPVLVCALAVSVLAFLFSNYVLPVANLKMGTLLYDVRQQKPSLYITEGVFYNGIEGYSIRIGKKEKDGITVHQVMIYDHRQGIGNSKVITAESGKMQLSDDKNFLMLTLFNGRSYEEGTRNRDGSHTHPLTRAEFESQQIRFDLSTFKLTRSNEEWFKDNWQMMNFKQLTYAIDSLEKRFDNRKKEMAESAGAYLYYLNDSVLMKKATADHSGSSMNPLVIDPGLQVNTVFEQAAASARNAKMFIKNNADEAESKLRTITRYKIEWHRKFTLSIACFILFLIGAPFGAIVRKGGLGLPLVVSVVLFIFFHVISITGEKFAKENVISPAEGMWIAPALLLPFGLLLVYKATHDSAFFDWDAYQHVFKKIVKSSPR